MIKFKDRFLQRWSGGTIKAWTGDERHRSRTIVAELTFVEELRANLDIIQSDMVMVMYRI